MVNCNFWNIKKAVSICGLYQPGQRDLSPWPWGGSAIFNKLWEMVHKPLIMLRFFQTLGLCPCERAGQLTGYPLTQNNSSSTISKKTSVGVKLLFQSFVLFQSSSNGNFFTISFCVCKLCTFFFTPMDVAYQGRHNHWVTRLISPSYL